jgi:aryl-alcohol dehydrogenase-like predicted oxidoreductase
MAQRFGASAAQLAIAWCTRHPAVASVTLGASGPAQLRENLAAIALAPLLDNDTMRQLDALFPAAAPASPDAQANTTAIPPGQ